MRLLPFAMLALVATSAHADDKRTVLDGVVVTPDGKPLPSARVAGTLEWNDSASTFIVDHLEPDGSWKLELTPSGSRLKSIRVTAWALGYSNAVEVRTVPRGAKGYKPVRLAMRPTISLEVTVVDGANAPVPTATVTIAHDSFSTEHPLKGKPQHVDRAGKVVFAGLNDQDTIDLEVTALGYLDLRLSSIALVKPLVIPIERGAMFFGRLVDRDTGKPIADCKLLTYRGDLKTDAAGNFQMLAPYGAAMVVPACEHYGTDWDLAPGGSIATYDVQDGANVHVIKVRRIRPVEVHVVDARKRPIAGATIQRVFAPKNPYQPMFVKHGPPTEDATTDAKGVAVFGESMMDEFELVVEGAAGRHVKLADVQGPITLELGRRP